ncbi:AAA family ATPase [Thiocystis violacea]|uniref:AAA family ATPase n=1 Tax=Thiocystis violacea TaxID=13725 RepID=UPI00190408B6|nr:AAA family ATPase [Thiocystis violacea]MBK1721094.1 hypothetical protein [Thiocystis violacea]
MRIQHLRFQNLNSLVGEWTLDLTHPAFAADGIFAITGPTGAGKTTILDAICLALYGRTPRLNKVTKSGNEIMSRQTGDCFAEVTFETQAGRFRCHWSQHRARRKANGELQAPRHEIADAATGRILESKIRDVGARIEAATGMDFDRFTRSMLLAQGDFAAFLQADPDQRAPILEQITGTEIYSRISVRVHERRADERKRLDTLAAELAGMQLLSEEDEATLNAGLEQKRTEDAELTQQLAAQQTAITWLDRLAQLAEALVAIDAARQDWQARQAKFQPERERLERASRALELAADHSGLTALRQQQSAEQASRQDGIERLPGQQETVNKALADLETATQQLAARKTEQQDGLLVLRQVRALDLKLQEKDGPIKTRDTALAGRQTALVESRQDHAATLESLAKDRTALETLLAQLEATKTDADLVEHLAGIRSRFEVIRQLDGQRQAKTQTVASAEAEATLAAQRAAESSKQLDNERGLRQEAEEQLRQRQLDLKDLLQDHTLSDWRTDLSRLQARSVTVDKAGEALHVIAETRQTQDALDTDQARLTSALEAFGQQREQLVQRRDALEREQTLLDTQLRLIRRVQDLEEARHQLRDGEPCPLCGSIDHPFATGHIPEPSETETRLDRVKADLKSTATAVGEIQIKQAETAKDLKQTADRQDECRQRLAVAERALATARDALAIEDDGFAWDQGLALLRTETQARLDRALSVVTDADSLEKRIAEQRDRLDQVRETVARIERDAQQAAHDQMTTAQTLERTRQEGRTLADQLDAALAESRAQVLAYDIGNLSIDQLEPILATLTERRNLWLERLETRTRLEHGIGTLEVQSGHQADLISKTAAEIAQESEALAALRREREQIAAERRDLFQDKRPDAEEARMAEGVTAAEQRLDTARQAQTAATQALETLRHRLAELEASLSARAERLQASEAAFAARLHGANFADEASYSAACLPEEERGPLAEQARQLDQERIQLETRERETRAALATEREKRVTDRPRTELQEALEQLVTAQRELHQEIGAISQRLAENSSRRQQQQARAKAIEQQRRECARWDALHDLIGSADGKKYRNFAQGLTFELMVGHANRQLRKMTDRYLLIRDAAQPLELNVIDNYQAGEVRSTKNLSGGESFIVSLALALGLSQMASQNVRVDSLFLDEGFGTLDEEALDTALETLASLQQDGKLIGIISHVGALKERIGTQIQVIPKTGGRSLLQGPGCGPTA